MTQPDAYVWDWHTLSWQAYGAFTAMVVWSLWMARRHLKLVWRKALGHDVVDDGTEMVSYRTALILLTAALGYEGTISYEPALWAAYSAALTESSTEAAGALGPVFKGRVRVEEKAVTSGFALGSALVSREVLLFSTWGAQ